LKNIDDDKEIIIKILEQADNLDEKRCRENNGHFLRLSREQQKILASKVLNMTEKDMSTKLSYNYYFLDFAKKLKSSYYNSLTQLIKILEKIRDMPIINNETLNIISKETKIIIDDMYSTTHYYYVLATISLLKADITEDKVGLLTTLKRADQALNPINIT
jgi:hypothetical protein